MPKRKVAFCMDKLVSTTITVTAPSNAMKLRLILARETKVLELRAWRRILSLVKLSSMFDRADLTIKDYGDAVSRMIYIGCPGILGPRDMLPVDLKDLKRSMDATPEETVVITTGLVNVLELLLATLYLGSGQSLTPWLSFLQYQQISLLALSFV